MSRRHDLLGRLGVLHLRKADVEFDRDVVSAILGRDQADLAVDRGIADLRLGTAGGDAERALEARRVADREQLLSCLLYTSDAADE